MRLLVKDQRTICPQRLRNLDYRRHKINNFSNAIVEKHPTQDRRQSGCFCIFKFIYCQQYDRQATKWMSQPG